ncbi:MHYT domain-containing protein [Trichocoleus sp. ST-U1]
MKGINDAAQEMIATYDLRLVVLSMAIAIAASYTALDLAGRVTAAQGRGRKLWLAGGAIAMGSGIWSMHFIGMLAYCLPISMAYDFPTVLVSMGVAAIASGAALYIVSREQMGWRRLLAGGIFMGCGIAAMHYTGMAGMRLEATVTYDLRLVAVSMAIAISASWLALWLAFHLRTAATLTGNLRKIGSAIVMGCAIAGMHYTGMAAVSYQSTNPSGMELSLIMDNSWLAVEIGIATTIVLALALLGSVFDRRLKIELARAEALRESEERFRALAQNASDILVIVAADGTIRYTSASIQSILGYEPENWLSKKAIEIVHPSDRSQAEKLLAAALNSPTSNSPTSKITAQFRIQKVDGSWRDFEAIANNLLDVKSVAGIAIAYRDITERQRSQESLRESEQRFRLMADMAPVMLWMCDCDKTCNYFNKGWLDFTGRTLEESIGMGWTQSLHPDDLQQCVETYRTAFDARENFEMEYRLRRFDGEYRWVFDRGVPRLTPGGSFVGYIGSCIDITERKQAEQEREKLLVYEQQARMAAEETNRLKDEFLATLSHELRTPLNSMLGWTQLLRTRKLDEAIIVRAMETIERNARLQTQLIEDLLDVSRIIQGKFRLYVRPLELSSVIEAAIATIQPAASAKSIRLESFLDSSAGLICGDPDRLQQVVWNLLSNAVKFTPKRGRVEVRLERSNSWVEIQVSDTGQGIAADFLPYVFDRFRQADSSITRSYGGLGLGLAVARHLIELHGGTVSAQSPGEGKGATFTVKLPILAVLIEPKDIEQGFWTRDNEGLSECPPGLNGLRALVVDDEADARELLTVILQHYGGEVMAVASAKEAMAVLTDDASDWRPDVLVSDIDMPNEDGYTFIRKVRALDAQQKGIPALALTAYAREEDRSRAVKAGFQTHVAKPVKPLALVAAIAHLSRRCG